MKFFHVYNDWHMEGLEKNNFINEDSGFKIQHKFSIPEELKFNKFAAKGGKLHSLIKENNYPFYVDRISGGNTYHKYDFDHNLIREYENLLGNWFLGFQLHESASNIFDAQWQNILTRTGHKGPYTVAELNEKLASSFAVMPNGVRLLDLSHQSAEECAPLVYPETSEEFFAQITAFYKKRMDDVMGHILPVDSYYVLTKLHNALGMKTFMPEVGWQIGQMRMAVASVRGTAENVGKTWGTYYETWIAAPTEFDASMPVFNDHPSNEWYNTQAIHPDDFTSKGPTGGSSRLLQKRIYYYSLMAGADYMAEEWGLNCSYSDMNTFSLSEYGIAKKDFIEFTRGMKHVKAEIPFAIVLPKEYLCLQVENPFRPHHFGVHRDKYMQSILGQEQKAFNGYVEDVLNFVYETYGGSFGNEGHTLTNSRFGDLFDIIYDDASDETFAKYAAVIDATPDSRVYAKRSSCVRVLKGDNFTKLEKDIRDISKEVLPVTVDKLLWVVSKEKDGRRFVSIFNNEGNYRAHPIGDTIDHKADARVKVSFKNAANMKAVKLSSSNIKIEKADDSTYYVDMPATEFAIFQY